MNTGSSLHPALNGEVTFDGDFARLHYQRRLAHPPQKVWSALTDPAQLKRWFMASSVAIDGRPGGSFETVAGPAQMRAHGRILTWDPPRVYEYEWIADPIADILPLGENAPAHGHRPRANIPAIYVHERVTGMPERARRHLLRLYIASTPLIWNYYGLPLIFTGKFLSLWPRHERSLSKRPCQSMLAADVRTAAPLGLRGSRR